MATPYTAVSFVDALPELEFLVAETRYRISEKEQKLNRGAAAILGFGELGEKRANLLMVQAILGR